MNAREAKTIAAAAGIAICALLFLGLFASDTGATSYNPSMSASVSNPAPGAHPNNTIEFGIPQPDANFRSVISFTPPAFGVVNCTAQNASPSCAGEAVSVGAITGGIDADATLGLLNNACSNSIFVHFDLINATTSMGTTVVYQDTDADGRGEIYEDADADGIPNGGEMYPDFLTRLARSQPFPGGSPLQPIQRLYGQTEVAGSDVAIHLLVFAPGTTINGVAMDPALGFPSFTLLNNTGDPAGVFEPTPITDFCTPLSSTTTNLGVSQDNSATGPNESGTVLRTNPGDGGYLFVIYTQSQHDADDDGIENSLDPCPTQGNAGGWDPRNPGTGGDTDADGLPNICDPANALDIDNDHDNDGWVNRGDNCPLMTNEDALDVDVDGIGDACDLNPGTPDGHQHEVCLSDEIDIGSGGAVEGNPLLTPPCGETPSTGTPTASPTTVGETPSLTPAPTPVGQTPSPTPVGQTPGPTPTPTPVGQTPSPSPSGQTTGPTASPTPTLAPGQKLWGDATCDGNVNPIDSLAELRFDGGLSVNQQAGCPMLDQVVNSVGAGMMWGDVNCDGSVNPVDSLALLRYDGGLPVNQQPGCPSLGGTVNVG